MINPLSSVILLRNPARATKQHNARGQGAQTARVVKTRTRMKLLIRVSSESEKRSRFSIKEVNVDKTLVLI